MGTTTTTTISARRGCVRSGGVLVPFFFFFFGAFLVFSFGYTLVVDGYIYVHFWLPQPWPCRLPLSSSRDHETSHYLISPFHELGLLPHVFALLSVLSDPPPPSRCYHFVSARPLFPFGRLVTAHSVAVFLFVSFLRTSAFPLGSLPTFYGVGCYRSLSFFPF
jgi:hypothetical protein